MGSLFAELEATTRQASELEQKIAGAALHILRLVVQRFDVTILILVQEAVLVEVVEFLTRATSFDQRQLLEHVARPLVRVLTVLGVADLHDYSDRFVK